MTGNSLNAGKNAKETGFGWWGRTPFWKIYAETELFDRHSVISAMRPFRLWVLLKQTAAYINKGKLSVSSAQNHKKCKHTLVMKNTNNILWVMTLYTLVVIYHFLYPEDGGSKLLWHIWKLPPLHGITLETTVFLIVIDVTVLNLTLLWPSLECHCA